jgi:hypothetical protein
VLRWGGCATYGNSCTPLARTATSDEIGYESFMENERSEKLQTGDKEKVD